MEIKRDYYLQQLIQRQGIPMIKIITGLRRCGKSYLLDPLFINYLRTQGVPDDHIIKLDLETRDNAFFRHPDVLNRYVLDKINDSRRYYVIIDEIQLVPDFVSVLNGWLKKRQLDVYVTGSNSRFLSHDVVTDFRGRGDNIHLYPLSFGEFISSQVSQPLRRLWLNYAQFGGLPLVATLNDPHTKNNYLHQQLDNVYLNDIIERHQIRQPHQLQAIMQQLASSIGSLTNPQKIANTYTSTHQEIDYKTVNSYLQYLSDAFLIEKVHRYDIRGRHYLSAAYKYYFTDIGLRHAVLDFRQQEINYSMENIIYLELRRRGFNVDVGVVDIKEKNCQDQYVQKRTEIDFVANLGDQRYYIQSAQNLDTVAKVTQEKKSLLNTNDTFRKLIIVDDDLFTSRYEDGIVKLNLFDFLLEKVSLDY